MGYRLPRIEFSRAIYIASGLDALGALAAGDCINAKQQFTMVGESPWVNNEDLVLTQVDIIEFAVTPLKKNYKLFLTTSDYSAAAAGATFTITGITGTEADLELVKGHIDCNAAYVDIGAKISMQVNKELNHRISFPNSAAGATLFSQLVLSSASATFASDNTILVRCHFALQ